MKPNENDYSLSLWSAQFWFGGREALNPSAEFD
jgi:hypothetical protein